MQAHWYELTLRGVSPGSYPRGAFTTDLHHVNYKGNDYGAVAYAAPLTEKQVDDYELRKIEPPRDLYDFEEYLLKSGGK